MYSSVANVQFTEVTESASVHGDLRYAMSDKPGTAWAYYPSTAAEGRRRAGIATLGRSW